MNLFVFVTFLAPLSMSPTKVNLIDVTHHGSNPPLAQPTIRKSPKKRPLKRYTIVSSSSSTESLASDSKGNRFRTSKILFNKKIVHTYAYAATNEKKSKIKIKLFIIWCI